VSKKLNYFYIIKFVTAIVAHILSPDHLSSFTVL